MGTGKGVPVRGEGSLERNGVEGAERIEMPEDG